MKTGKKFRLLRHRKQLTQAQACGNILSRSRLSTFEQGKGDIAHHKLMKLLERLDISLCEFKHYMQSDHYPTQTEFYQDVHNAKQTNNLLWLKSIENEQHCLYNDTNRRRFLFNYMIAQQAQHALQGAPYETHKIDQIYNYLKQVRHWHKYEINLFRHTLFCMAYPQIRTLCFNVIDFLPNNDQEKCCQNNELTLLLDLFRTCLDYRELADAKVCRETALQLMNRSDRYYEQTRFKFLEGIRLILTGDVDHGMAKAHEAIDIMDMFEDYVNANRSTSYLKQTLSTSDATHS